MELFLILLFQMPLLNFMFTILLSLVVVTVAFVAGLYVGYKNANSSKTKAVEALFKAKE